MSSQSVDTTGRLIATYLASEPAVPSHVESRLALARSNALKRRPASTSLTVTKDGALAHPWLPQGVFALVLCAAALVALWGAKAPERTSFYDPGLSAYEDNVPYLDMLHKD